MHLTVETSTAELDILKVTREELQAKLHAAVLQVMRDCGANPTAAAATVDVASLPSRAEFAMRLMTAEAQRLGQYD